jgi:hypothetical protein
MRAHNSNNLLEAEARNIRIQHFSTGISSDIERTPARISTEQDTTTDAA